MIIIIYFNFIKTIIVNMKISELIVTPPELIAESRELGARIARLRKARRVLQSDAAVRAGVSRPTAGRIEAGDPGRTLGQVLRYLHAIAPGVTLLQLMQQSDPALLALSEAEKTKRVRRLSGKQLEALDF